jgi:hypothetical protein
MVLTSGNLTIATWLVPNSLYTLLIIFSYLYQKIIIKPYYLHSLSQIYLSKHVYYIRIKIGSQMKTSGHWIWHFYLRLFHMFISQSVVNEYVYPFCLCFSPVALSLNFTHHDVFFFVQYCLFTPFVVKQTTLPVSS